MVKFTEQPPGKNMQIGVCVDVSKKLIMPVVTESFFILICIPVSLGLIFYLIYYWLITNKVTIPLLIPQFKSQNTKIGSHYYSS